MTNKNIEKKKTATKAVAKEAEVVATKAPVVEEKKEPVVEEKKEPVVEEKKATEKAPAKKTTTKKTTAKKEIKVSAFVEYFGKQVEEKDMIARVKKAWTSSGKKIGDIKTMELYIKPEESAVYYVINGTETGAVAF